MKLRELQYLPSTVQPIHLLDLRPHAASWPVLQSLRYAHTQQLAADAAAAGHDGLAYRSAQQHGQDCFVLFGTCLLALRLVWRKALVLPDGSIHAALVDAIRGAQIEVVP